MKIFKMLLLLAGAGFIAAACSNPEDEYLGKLYSKESRSWAINQLKANKDKIVRKDKAITKLLKLDQTPDIPMALGAVGEIGDPVAIPRIGEIVDACLKTINVRNLKTLEAAALALGQIGDPSAAPILGKYFTITTPEQLAVGQREKPESVAKRAAIEALAKMPEAGKQYMPQILQVFESKAEDFGTKYTVAGVLGDFGDPSVTKLLVGALFYEEMGFSLFPEARKSLANLGKKAEDELIKAYEGQNVQVNSVLDGFRDKAMKQFCPEYMSDPEKKKKGECEKHDEFTSTVAGIDATAKIKTSIVLSDIRSNKAADMLIRELDEQLSKDQKQPFLTEHLSVSLGKLGDFRATDVLLRMISKKFALSAAKKTKGPQDKNAAIQAKIASRGQEISIRMKGAEALAILGDKKALPYLLEALKAPIEKEMNIENQWLYFYEPQVWASDAYTRIIDDAKSADEFIAFATKFIDDAQKMVTAAETKAKEKLTKDVKDFATQKPEDQDKKIKAEAALDPNYDSSSRSVTMMKRFVKRAEATKLCNADIDCYAKQLSSKEPSAAEKSVYMIAFAGKMSSYAEQLKPVFKHTEPFVRVALTYAMLRTEDKVFMPILADAVKTEGDKVEYAESSKEYKAILSYLESI